MASFIWPADDGWPYPDGEKEVIDLDADVDDDLLSLTSPSSHVFDDLEPLERRVVTAHYGLHGQPARSMQQLHREWGLPADALQDALGAGLGKLRTHLR
jgi:DNA-directed RNA polymerase sigma subunit (sigma70/sigma32)